jgi:hypothetical protein
VEDLIKLEKTGIVESAQDIRIGFEPKFALTGFENRTPETTAYCAEIAGTPRVLNGAHVAPDFLSIAPAHWIDCADLPVDNHEGWSLSG